MRSMGDDCVQREVKAPAKNDYMKNALLLLGLFLFLYGCSQKNQNIEAAEKSVKDSLTSSDENNAYEKISPYQRELNNAFADPTIDKYYKEIYKQDSKSEFTPRLMNSPIVY